MRLLKFLSVCVLSLCFTNGCETWKDAASVPQSSPSPASTELPRKDYFANHKIGEEPKWQIEFFRDTHAVFSSIPRLCRMHQDSSNIFLFNSNFNYVDYNKRYHPHQSHPIERYEFAWFNRLAKIPEALDRAGRVIFTGKDCKKQIALGLEFLNQHGRIAYARRFRSDIKAWDKAQGEARAKEHRSAVKQEEERNAEVKRKEAEFAASPEGRIDNLAGKYVGFMIVQDCYEVRKNYVIKYIDKNVFNTVKTNIRTIENETKKAVPGLNTEKVWADAKNAYMYSFGDVMAMHKNVPQNHNEYMQGLCTSAVLEINSSAQREAPKKNF